MPLGIEKPSKGVKSGKEKYVGRAALVGTPNVGKSTLFNALTGQRQHTGNWAGKTVECALGVCKASGGSFEMIDLPGTYSLYSHSPEEEVARDYILKSEADLYVVVIDSSCPDRSINLALQLREVTDRVFLCFNLIDEAKRRGVEIDIPLAESIIGAPAVAVSAKRRKTLKPLRDKIFERLSASGRCGEVSDSGFDCDGCSRSENKGAQVEDTTAHGAYGGGDDNITARYVSRVADCIKDAFSEWGNRRVNFLGSMILFSGTDRADLLQALGLEPGRVEKIRLLCDEYCKQLVTNNASVDSELERISADFALRARTVAERVSRGSCESRTKLDKTLDSWLTGKRTAYPVMMLLLFLVLSITVFLSNYPSELLSELFGFIGSHFDSLLSWAGAPTWLHGLLYDGIYTTLTEIVSVMLPPMAIFFPLFTLLEDIGFLPRFAYNLDAPLRCVGACGKQALTMCMGLGCNAVGVTGCRIIDSQRERRIAIITNSLMPCNGRFPTIILVCGMFLAAGGFLNPALSALLVLAVIMLGVGATFLLSFLLSKTFLRGAGTFFTIELPPFRIPNIAEGLTRSFIDRTLKVLWRAVVVAIPAGAVIWLLSTVTVGEVTLLSHITQALDPIGRLLGFDGVVLAAFIIGIPASEIVIPLALVGYLGMGFGDAIASADAASILISAGWTVKTGVCVVLFSLMHWPCATTLSTIYKETGSFKVTLLSAIAPTVLGCIFCILVNLFFSLV